MDRSWTLMVWIFRKCHEATEGKQILFFLFCLTRYKFVWSVSVGDLGEVSQDACSLLGLRPEVGRDRVTHCRHTNNELLFIEKDFRQGKLLFPFKIRLLCHDHMWIHTETLEKKNLKLKNYVFWCFLIRTSARDQWATEFQTSIEEATEILEPLEGPSTERPPSLRLVLLKGSPCSKDLSIDTVILRSGAECITIF